MRWALLAGALVSCAQPLVDDTFTPEQWATLRAQLAPPVVPLCTTAQCDGLAQLGRCLFYDKALSGPLLIDDPNGLGSAGTPGRVACATCHDPSRDYVDTRAEDNVSLGAGSSWTRHNALSTVNLSLKAAVAPGQQVFTWTGQYTSARDVFENLALKNAMNSSAAIVAARVRAAYATQYATLFSDDGSDGDVLEHVADAFDAYESHLTSTGSPFDRFVAGDDSALTDQEKHGFEIFAGSGICIECHDGPLLTDLQFHNTGVPQIGDHVPAQDFGRGSSDSDPVAGEFLTPSLRNVALTGPYMHAGQFATLDGVDGLDRVVAFYRAGGGDSDYAGVRDPRLQPLDITDDDAADLVAFLGALTGAPPDPAFGSACP